MILLFNKQVVVSLVDDGEIELLGGDEVRFGEREVVFGLEDLDNSTVVKSGGKSSKKIGEEGGLQTLD